MSSSRMIPCSSLLEEPRDGAADGQLAAEILLAEERAHVARPVDLGDDPAHFGAALGVGRVPRPRTVGGDVEPARPDRAQAVHGGTGLSGAIEDGEENRGFHAQRGVSWRALTPDAIRAKARSNKFARQRFPGWCAFVADASGFEFAVA